MHRELSLRTDDSSMSAQFLEKVLHRLTQGCLLVCPSSTHLQTDMLDRPGPMAPWKWKTSSHRHLEYPSQRSWQRILRRIHWVGLETMTLFPRSKSRMTASASHYVHQTNRPRSEHLYESWMRYDRMNDKLSIEHLESCPGSWITLN